MRAMKCWEIIADNLSKAGCSWGCVLAIDSNGRAIWIADAHRDNGKRIVADADEKLTAFMELSCLRGNCLDFGKRCFEVQLEHGRRALQKYFRKAKKSLAILLDFS
jgi:hypothetical protein